MFPQYRDDVIPLIPQRDAERRIAVPIQGRTLRTFLQQMFAHVRVALRGRVVQSCSCIIIRGVDRQVLQGLIHEINPPERGGVPQ